jgi:hypothetical protein
MTTRTVEYADRAKYNMLPETIIWINISMIEIFKKYSFCKF